MGRRVEARLGPILVVVALACCSTRHDPPATVQADVGHRPATFKKSQPPILSSIASIGVPAAAPLEPADGTIQAKLSHALGKLPLYFIENKGQADPRVAFYVHGQGTSVYFTPQGITLAMTGPEEREGDTPGPSPGTEPNQAGTVRDAARQRWAVKLDFVGAKPDAKPLGEEQTPAVVSYFKGSAAEWKTGLPTYSRVVYPDLWPGIDLVYSGTGSRLKYTFLVRPGADPDQIQLAYRGATAVEVTGEGRLRVSTPVGGFEDDTPYSYQEVGESRLKVQTSYALKRATAPGTHRYAFRVGSYDKSKPLIIDPVILTYCGYLGGSGIDRSFAVAVDGSGNAYVTGYTYSTEASFPETVGPDLTFNGGGIDAFVAKVNASGTALIYSGYIGGSGTDQGYGIAVDGAGNAYVSGLTTSTEATFPETVGPDLTFNGIGDAFVAKVNAAGNALTYCGYIGGAGDDHGWGIAVDGSGNAYVTGHTRSTQATFPVAVGPDLTLNGNEDAFVARVNAAGTGLTYAGYIGGSADERGFGISVDSSGNAYVTGRTQSTETSFPVAVGPDLTFNGNWDAFVAKVDAIGTTLAYCGYLGGSFFDYGFGIAVDSSGNAYVVGQTGSTEATFPVAVGPDLTFNAGFDDAFVAKVNGSGSSLTYCGYIGGSGGDGGQGIAVDSAGNAYVAGWTFSTEASFPVVAGPDLTYNGGSYDAFVAKVNGGGSSLSYCGYVGGSGDDVGQGIAVDGAGRTYVTGYTTSSEVSFPEAVGPDLTYNGGYDAFVARVDQPVVIPRSIGTAAPYTTGQVTVSNGSVAVTGIGGTLWATAAVNRGRGDYITITGQGTYTVVAVNSNSSLTLTAPFTGTGGTYNYTIGRKFATIDAWRACIDTCGSCGVGPAVASASLVADNRVEVGVLYKDSAFTGVGAAGGEITQIGSAAGDNTCPTRAITTDANHYVTLTADGINRHYGVPGAGVVIDGQNQTSRAGMIRIRANYTRIEWVEIKNVCGAVNRPNTAAIKPEGTASNLLVDNVILHDDSNGIFMSSTAAATLTLRNSILYNNRNDAVSPQNTTDNITVENTTILRSGAWGVNRNAATITARNTISLHNPSGDFAPGITQSYNLSSDASAAGAGSLPGQTAADVAGATASRVVFKNCPAGIGACTSAPNGFPSGTEGGNYNLLLQSSAVNTAVDAGTDLSASFQQDIEGQYRVTAVNGWDIGADELNGATTVADLAITKTDGQATEVPGTPVSYSIAVTNLGPLPVTGATITDTLPASLTGASWTCTASPGSSCTASGSGSILDTVNLLAGGSATYTLTATINPAATGSLINTATVAPPGSVFDPVSANNSAPDNDALTPQADLQVLKSGPATAVLGETIVYSVTARNNGPSNATGVMLVDTLPAEVVFLSSVPSGPACTYDGGLHRLNCTIGPLAAGNVFPVSITVRIASSGAIMNAASVSGTLLDPVSVNNTAIAATDVDADPCRGSGAGTWWSGSWARRRKITFDNSGQPGSLLDFPVLVKLDGVRIDYARTQNAGQDIRFVDADDQTVLAHEIEKWDEAGSSYVWVRVPQIDASSNTDFIWMYYDNPSAPALPAAAAENTWDASFRMVQHLEETAGTHLDSTAFNTDSSLISVAPAPPQGTAAGQIDGTDSFVRASAHKVEVVDNGSLDMAAADSFTVEAWARTTFAASYQMAFGKESRGVPTDGELQLWTNGGNASFWLNDGAGNTARADSATYVADNAWHYLVGRWNESTGTAEVFVDGVIVASGAQTPGILGAIASSTPGLIGDEGDGPPGNANWDGLLDEIRVSKVARSNNWIRAQNLSMRDAFAHYDGEAGTCHLRSIGTRLDYGTAQLDGGGTKVTATDGSKTVTGTGTTWKGSNRGRGDRINIEGADYTIAGVTSDTELTLTASFVGTTGADKSYSISRKFASLADWESCIDGLAPPPVAACEGVASDSLPVDGRGEIGIAYNDAGYAGYPFAGGLFVDGRPDNQNTDLAHNITLTADDGNRHYGLPGTGAVVDNAGGTSAALQISDDFVTVEWLEIRSGGGATDGLLIDGLTGGRNQVVVRSNLIHDVPGGDGIEIRDDDTVADVVNNILYGHVQHGISVTATALTAASPLRLLNNTLYNNLGGIWADPAGSYSSVLLRNNLSVGNGADGDYNIPGGPAGTSSHNLGEDGTELGASPLGNSVNSTVGLVQFASEATGDLHIQFGSAARYAAIDLSAIFPKDVDAGGRTVPWDIGADEFGAAGATADLAIQKDDGQATEVPGTAVTYTITVTNNGPDTLTSLTVTDPVPLEILSPVFTPSTGSYNSGTGLWTGLNLGASQAVTLTLTGTISPSATGTLTNWATVAPPGGFTDPGPSNNWDDDADPLTPQADVSITKTASPGPVPVGVDLTYTLIVTNNGPSNTANVRVTDNLPPGVVFQSATPPCTQALGVVDCLLGAIAAGSPPTSLTVVVRATAPGTILNTASVTHDVTDTNPANNSASAATVVPAWRATGAMNVARANHTATLLQSGKVLVVGGDVNIGVPTASVELYDPLTGLWSLAAPMVGPRSLHSATLLPNGKVLVAGGYGGGVAGTLNLADLYDPVAGTWSSTGPLGVDRRSHTATLLGDGRVLVAGGFSTLTGDLPIAEVYDPGTGSWSATPGLMITGTRDRTATLLPNGKVLLAGGLGANASELFDPATGLFTSTVGTMSVDRDHHSATLLPDGKVLVAGGSGGVSTAEVFDPATGTWTPTNSMSGVRDSHTATLLPSGKVLVASSLDPGPTAGSSELYHAPSGTWSSGPPLLNAHGMGTATLLPSGRVLLAGGYDAGLGAYVGAAELYLTTGTFAPTGSLGIPRYSHTTTLLPDGKVLAAGDVFASAPTERYDPASGVWAPTPSGLVTGRNDHTATLLINGKVLVAGGEGGAGTLAKAELFEPATSSWAATGDLNASRRDHTATLLPDGTVLVPGGVTGINTCVPSYEVYKPVAGTWLLKGVLPICRSQHAAVLLLNGKVLLIGGTEDGFAPLATTILYDPVLDTWTPQGNLARPRQFPSATLLPNGKVLVVGGTNDPLTEVYDPASGTWSPSGNFNAARANAPATLLPDGRVLVAGGTFGATVRKSAEVFDPATLAWSFTADLVAPRHSHTTLLLPNGKVLVVGGVDIGGPPGLATSELYDLALGFLEAWRPVLASASPDPVLDSMSLLTTGNRFRGISEASGSQGAQDSSTDYPLVQLRRLDNDAVRWLPVDPGAGWSDLSFRSLPLGGLVPGEALVTVFTNGIPSVSRTVTVECPPAAFNTTPAGQSVCTGSTVQFTVDVTGSCPEFQWRKDGIPLADGGRFTGTRANLLQITSVDPSDGGGYDVVVALPCSSTFVTSPVATLAVSDPLSGISADPAGPYTVCQATGCTAGPLNESHVGGGPVTHQWGFRTSTGGPISDIPGETGASYLIRGTDFPGPGTYLVVVRTQPLCGVRLTSNEIVVVVDSAGVTDTVRYLTVTSSDMQNVLEWLNPPGFGDVRIRYTTDPTSCSFPSATDGSDGSLLLLDLAGTPNEPGRLSHTPITNDDHFCYTVWVDKGGPFSAGKTIEGRPFATPPGPGAKWGYNMGIFSMVPPGNGVGVVYAVANDGSLHSMVKGAGPQGGTWPGPLSALPVWKPQSMNGPSQGRPSGVPVATAGSTRTVFLSSQDGHVYAFDAYTGALAWSPSSPLLAPAPGLGAHPSGVFTVFGGTRDLIFVGTRDGAGSKFYALRLLDGDTVGPGWVFDGTPYGRIGAINGQAAVDQVNKRVYFASREFDATDNKTVWCLDLETGIPCWAPRAHGSIDTGVSLYGDRLLVGTSGPEVKAIDTSDGTEAWSFALPPAEGPVKGYVAVDRLTGDAYFSTLSKVWALDANGNPKWLPGGDRDLVSPSIPVYPPGTPYVYVGAGDGKLHRLHATDGSPAIIAPFPLALGDGSAGVGSVTIDLGANFLYVGTEAGVVYAVRLP